MMGTGNAAGRERSCCRRRRESRRAAITRVILPGGGVSGGIVVTNGGTFDVWLPEMRDLEAGETIRFPDGRTATVVRRTVCRERPSGCHLELCISGFRD